MGEVQKSNQTAFKKKLKIESYNLMLIGLFLGGGSILFIGSKMLVGTLFMIRIVVISCLGGLIIPMKIWDGWFGWNKIESFLVNILGIGPILCSFLFWINFIIPVETRTETHQIIEIKIESDLDARFVFELEDSAMFNFPEFRSFILNEDILEYKSATAIEFTISKGILGYEYIQDLKVKTRA